MKSHHVFCVSDHTGVTVEAMAKSVLSQFPALEFSLIALPFVDSPEKAQAARGADWRHARRPGVFHPDRPGPARRPA